MRKKQVFFGQAEFGCLFLSLIVLLQTGLQQIAEMFPRVGLVAVFLFLLNVGQDHLLYIGNILSKIT